MGHRFVIMRNDKIETYDQYESIPSDLDHVIEFVPEIPTEPHTPQQHEEIDSWPDLFSQLMDKAYGNNRHFSISSSNKGTCKHTKTHSKIG